MVTHPFTLSYLHRILPGIYDPAGRQNLFECFRASYARIALYHLLDSFCIGTYLLYALETCTGRGLMQRKAHLMKTWLKLITVFLLLCMLTVSAQAEVGEPFVLLQTSQNAPEGVFFFGESTTAHLARAGGVLDTDEHRGKVLRDESGTRCLDMRILSSPVFYNGSKIAFAEAVERAQPRVLVLSFGLNGITRWSRDNEAFLRNYRALIDGIRARSPNTKILLQSVYPVGENTSFSLSKEELNRQICNLNTHVASLTSEYGNVYYADTAKLLRDESGALRSAYDMGDGIHLTNDAYRIVLQFLYQQIIKTE